MILTTFTLFHTAISLIAILTGFVTVAGMLVGNPMERWTRVFLATTVATSVTGFLFPVHHFMPSHAVGIVSLVLLATAIFARYRRQLLGYWRQTYVVTATLSLYLNVFVLIVQAFGKVPALKSLAPTQSEPPFKLAHLAALAIFVVIIVCELIRFRKLQPSRIPSIVKGEVNEQGAAR
jgi:hypothetical protein